MQFQLVIVRGRSDVKVHRLGPGITVAGRQEGCQLQIKASQVSRRHCEFFEQKGRLLLKDLNSSNGTFVNGEKIEGTQAVEHGDEVSIGGVLFRVENLDASGVVAAPRAVPSNVGDADEAILIEDDDDETVLEVPEPSPSKVTPKPAESAKGARRPAEEEVEPPDAPGGPELGEDAVADFLLDLDLDDDDKV